MGLVFRADDTVTGETVALKALRPETLPNDPETVERFLREGEALRRLNHPNIVKLLNMIDDGANHYLVMEFVGGGSLEALLDQGSGPLPVDRILDIALDLSDALTRAHRLDIVHRDVKPSNVLVAEDGTPRLTDFGVAYFANKERLSGSNDLLGTLAYLSPEALSNEQLDARTDIWAFGVLLFELLTGRTPFDTEHFAGTFQAILTMPPPDIEALRPDCPVSLADLTYRMLEKDRTQRIPSARRVGSELESIIQTFAVRDGAPGQQQSENRQRLTGTMAAANTPATAPTAASSPVHTLPPQPTPFVGREGELEKLAQMLDDPATPLVTVVGPGGMGKTRLAMQVGLNAAAPRPGRTTKAHPFHDGVFWVELSPLASSALIMSAIADAVGFKFFPGGDPAAQLKTYLTGKRLLLVMDNFEHLLDGAGQLSELLTEAGPGLKVLATSRERLGLSLETTFVLSGMGSSESPLAGQRAGDSAVELFLQAARRVKFDFEPGPGGTHEVTRICRLVQGTPLAIVLAAAWIEVLPPNEIADEVQRGFDFLQARFRDLPERQQSIRAVFDHSWNLLEAPERALFARLSVFRGGFTRDAAQSVTDASLRSLAVLMNKSLITRDPETGRYSVHELLRQYAEEQLGLVEADREQAADRHSAYYERVLKVAESGLKGERLEMVAAAAAEIDSEIDNVRTAWTWVVASNHWDRLDQFVRVFDVYYELRGQLAESEAKLDQAVKRLERLDSSSNQSVSPLLGRVLTSQAKYSELLGRYSEAATLANRALSMLDEHFYPEARANALLVTANSLRTASLDERLGLAEQGLALYRKVGHTSGTVKALAAVANLCWELQDGLARAEALLLEANALQESHADGAIFLPGTLTQLGFVLTKRGRYGQGLELLQKGLALIRSRGDLLRAMFSLSQLSYVELSLGDYEAAELHAREALSLTHDAAHWEMEMWSHLQLGLVLQEQGRIEEALTYYTAAKAHSVARATRSSVARGTPVLAHVELLLGSLSAQRGAYVEARAHLERSLSDYQQIGSLHGIAQCCDALGFLACQEQRYDEARDRFRRAFELDCKCGVYSGALGVVAGVAHVLAGSGQAIRAVEISSFAARHSATSHGTRTRRIEPLLAKLRDQLPATDFAAAVGRSQAIDLQAVGAELVSSH